VDAYQGDTIVSEPDLADPETRRWFAFTPPVLEAGVRAVFGFPLRVGTVRLGALDLYRDRPGELSSDQHADALVRADVAARTHLSACGRSPTATTGCSMTWPRTSSPAGSGSDEPARPPPPGGTAQKGGLGMTREAEVVRSLVEMADTLVDDYDVVDLLTGLTDRCVTLLGVSAGMMLASPSGSLGLVASSSEAMRLLELFELQAQEGPCLDAFRSGGRVDQEDLRARLRADARNANLPLTDVARAAVDGTLDPRAWTSGRS
jgi:hypothetical protein